MISRKIPKFLKISHHKFTSRKLFSHIFPKNPKTGNQVFPNIPRFSHFGKYIPFCVGIPILGKVGKPAKTKLVRAAPKLHTMENNGENLGIFGKFFPNFPKREIFFPKKLLFLTVLSLCYIFWLFLWGTVLLNCTLKSKWLSKSQLKKLSELKSYGDSMIKHK